MTRKTAILSVVAISGAVAAVLLLTSGSGSHQSGKTFLQIDAMD